MQQRAKPTRKPIAARACLFALLHQGVGLPPTAQLGIIGPEFVKKMKSLALWL